MQFSKKQIRIVCIVLAASLLLTIGVGIFDMISSTF